MWCLWLSQVRHKLMGDTKMNTESSEQNSVNHKSTHQLLQIIDTTLLKCYLQVGQSIWRVWNECTVKPWSRVSREGNSHSVGQEIPHLLWNPKLHCCVYRSPHHCTSSWANWIQSRLSHPVSLILICMCFFHLCLV